MKTVFFLLLILLQSKSTLSYERDSTRSPINPANFTGFVLEEGVSIDLLRTEEQTLLKIETEAAPTKGPSAYLVTVNVTPGERYTFFVKGHNNGSCRVFHFITSPKGNVVWPGAELPAAGISRTAFTAPVDVNQVSLALSFLYPQQKNHILVEDFAFFEGDVESWPEGSVNGLGPLLQPAKTWVIWFYLVAMFLLVLVLHFTQREWPQIRSLLKIRTGANSLGRKTISLIDLIMVAGVALALFQFIFNRSLWLDEASIGLNIVTRNYDALLDPLDYGQIAPILFLWIEKLFLSLFEDADLGLRFFVMASHVASIFLVKEVSLLLTNDKRIQHGVVAVYCFATVLLYYSSEVKQYAVDVLVLLLMLFLTLRKDSSLRRHFILLSIAGCLSIWLSNISVIVLFVCGLYCLKQYSTRQPVMRNFITVILTWLTSFTIYYIFFIHDHPSQGLMVDYWQEENAFMPINPFSREFWGFVLESFKMIFGSFLFHYWYLGGLLYVLGLSVLVYQKKKTVLYFLLFPVALHLGLSALTIYPFDLRLILYQMPLYFIGMITGLSFLCGVVRFNFAKYLVYGPAVLAAIFLLSSFPLKREEIKKTIDYLNSNIQPGDKVYINSGAERAFRYYHTIGYIDFNNEVHYEKFYMEDFSGDFPPGRTWMVFSHIWTDQQDMEKKIISFVANRAKVKESYEVVGSSIYLIQ